MHPASERGAADATVLKMVPQRNRATNAMYLDKQGCIIYSWDRIPLRVDIPFTRNRLDLHWFDFVGAYITPLRRIGENLIGPQLAGERHGLCR